MASIRPGVLVLLVLVGLLGFVPQAGRAAEPFNIDVILPETGAAAFLGKEEGQAIRAVETLVNRSGGITGRPIHFDITDDQSNPQVAVQLMNADIAKKVAIIIGSSFTSTCGAIAPLVEKGGPVDYCLSPGIHPAAGSYVFSASPSTKTMLSVTEHYFHARGWYKVATITSTDATGQDADRGIGAAFEAPGSGETIVDREHFNASDVSVDAQMARIQNSGAQALIAWSTGTPFATVLRGASDVGLHIPMLSTPGNLTYAQMKAYAPFMYNRLYFPAFPFIDPANVTDPPVRRAVDAMYNAFKPDGVRPDVGQSLGWDPAMMVIDVLKHLGINATATQIQDYIHGIGAAHTFIGVYGKYDFTTLPQRGLSGGSILVARWEPTKSSWVAVSRPGGTPIAGSEVAK